MRLTQVLQWTAAVALAGVLAPAALAVNTSRVEYYHHDALGNVRVVTDATGQVIERHDYLPFGEECTTGVCAANPGLGAGQPRKFTGKERDAETGLDYFGARYYGSRIGRFTSIDPVYTWRENLVDPQRWNRYAYGRNNPLRYIDPDGRAAREMTGAQVAQLQARAAAAGPSNDQAAGIVAATGLVLTGAPLVMLAADAAPLFVMEARIGAATCLASAGCQNTVRGLAEGASDAPPGAMGLTPAQATKLARFNKKLPAGATGTRVDALADGVLFTAEVPGRVEGSKAVYQKAVNASGETVAYMKTTVDPAGEVVHVKDKLVSEK